MATVEYSVGANPDAGQSSGMAFNNISEFGYVMGGINLFARFTGVTIPAGATIDVAYLMLYANSSFGTLSRVNCRIYAADTQSPDHPHNQTEYNAFTKTTAYASDWVPTAWTNATWYNSPSIKTVIQELVNSYSYAAGDTMLLLGIGQGSGFNSDYVYSYNYPNDFPPKLHIEYTEGGAADSFGGGSFMRGVGRGFF